MALTINSITPALFEVVFGQVIEMTVTVDANDPLTGQTIRVYPALFDPNNNFVIPSALPTNYWEIASYPGAPGTSTMIWVGSAMYQNLSMTIEHVTTTQFILRLDAIVGVDRFDVNQQLDPAQLLTPQSFQFSIYEDTRYLNLHILNITSSEKVLASREARGLLPRDRLSDKFDYFFKSSPSDEVVLRPIADQDMTVVFSFENTTGMVLTYDIVVFDEAQSIDQLQSIQDNLNLVGATSPTPTALPSLTLTDINSMTNLVNYSGDMFQGEFVIDANRMQANRSQTIFIVVEDTNGKKIGYQIDFTPFTQAVPDPTATVQGLIEGDTIRTTGCFMNVAACQKFTGYSFIDVADYNTEVSTLGLSGDFSSNLISIDVYALDHRPVTNEDLTQFTKLGEARTAPLALGGAFFEYVVPENAIGVTFLIFDYVFKDHSIRTAIKLLHPAVSGLDTVVFRDSDDNVLANQACYDYSNGLKVNLSTADINAFDWDEVYINRYVQGEGLKERVDIIVPGSLALDDDDVDFEIDLDKVSPGDCFCLVAANLPVVSEAIAGCGNRNFNYQFDYNSPNRFTLAVDINSGTMAQAISYINIKRNNTIVHTAFDIRDWGTDPPWVLIWNADSFNINEFTVEFFIYTDNGCNYYSMDNIELPGIVGGSVNFSPITVVNT